MYIHIYNLKFTDFTGSTVSSKGKHVSYYSKVSSTETKTTLQKKNYIYKIYIIKHIYFKCSKILKRKEMLAR